VALGALGTEDTKSLNDMAGHEVVGEAITISSHQVPWCVSLVICTACCAGRGQESTARKT